MRHERVLDKSKYGKVDVAALWPVGIQLVPLPFAEGEECERRLDAEERTTFAPTPAAADIPVAVGGMLFASYVALIGAFAIATAGSGESIFAITISFLFVIAFFTVPRILLRVEPKGGRKTDFHRFMTQGIDTLTGHAKGRDVLVQMMIVPVLLTFGALCMGVAAAIYL